MGKSKKIKLFVGLIYILLVGLFLFLIFSKFSFSEMTSYSFIKNNRNYFYELRQSNLYFLGFSFILFTTLWIFSAGFGAPIALLAGFIFGKWFGLLFTIIGITFGATLLYIFANYFLKEMIRDKFLNRFKNLETKFRKSEFIYLLIFRFVGGIPLGIQNVLPCIFDVKVSNFFWSTFLGMIPSLFIVISIGSGLEEIIDQNLEAPNLVDLITSPSIYIPMIAFFALLGITIFFRKMFYKN